MKTAAGPVEDLGATQARANGLSTASAGPFTSDNICLTSLEKLRHIHSQPQSLNHQPPLLATCPNLCDSMLMAAWKGANDTHNKHRTTKTTPRNNQHTTYNNQQPSPNNTLHTTHCKPHTRGDKLQTYKQSTSTKRATLNHTIHNKEPTNTQANTHVPDPYGPPAGKWDP